MPTRTRTQKKGSSSEKVEKLGIKRAQGFLYYIDKKGHVMRARLTRGRGSKDRTVPTLVQKVGICRTPGYLYFLDRDGDISRVKMANAKPAAQKPSRG